MVVRWWTWRERVAATFGPWFWPAWYVAPRSSRDRWAKGAQLLDEADGDFPLVPYLRLLQEDGVELPPEAIALLAAAE